MPRPKFTRKDDYLLMMGIAVALMFQVIYDMVHQVVYQDINWGWMSFQTVLIICLFAFVLVTLRKMESYA